MKTVDEYKVEADGVPAHVEIVDEPEQFVLMYNVNRPDIKTATESILKDLKEQIIRDVDLSTEEFVNSREIENVRRKFREQAMDLLEDELPETSEDAKQILIGNLIHEMLGLGDIEILLNDENLEEIVVNSAEEPVWVYHKENGWLKSDVEFEDDDQIKNYASDIGRRVGKNISSLHPLLDAHLPSGDRTNATLYPISTQGNTITIRKFARDPWTITDFIRNGTVSKEVAAFLWLCMQYEMNVLVSGGTGAGKCLTPDARVSTSDGRLKPIEDLVEADMDNATEIDDGWRSKSEQKVFSMNDGQEIRETELDRVWKREAPEEMYKIKTESGREIKATPEHPFFSNSRGELNKKRSDQLEEGEFIPSASRLEVTNDRESLEVTEWCRKNNIEVKNTEETFIEAKSVRGREVRLPKEVTPELCELTGLLAGDGHLQQQEDGASRVEHHCQDREVRKHFRQLAEETFSVETKEEVREDRVNKSVFNSRTILEFLQDFMEIPTGKKSGSIRIPEKIVLSDNEAVARFLRGYFEAECHVNVQKSNIEIISESSETMEQTANTLKRFNVFTRIKDREIDGKKFKKLIIGPEWLEDFKQNIGLISDRKKEALSAASTNRTRNTNRDLIPCEDLLRELKQLSRLHDHELAEMSGLSRRGISRYLDGSRKPSRDAVKNIVKALRNREKQLEETKFKIEELKEKCSGDREDARDDCLDVIYSEKTESKEIAENSGVSPSSFSRWKNGTLPSPETLYAVADTIEEQTEEEIHLRKISHEKYFKEIKQIRKDLKATTLMIKEETGVDVGPYETGAVKTTEREKLRSVLNFLGERVERSISKLAGKISELEKLCSDDIRWDRIKNIETFQPETEWVYDLTVPGDHTFVANGLVAHNTSMLNVLMPFIPPSQRILSIEDTREVQLPEFLHWVPLTTREPNPEGKGGVSMLDLLVNALRMRPDRILVGEIRRKRQAEVLFEAMHTGHSVYSTLHADTAEQTVRRLINPPIDVPKTMVEAVDLNLVMFRDRRRNFRRAMELAEVSMDEESEEVEANVLYEWQNRNDKMVRKQESSSIYETLRLHAGMTDEEIDQSIQEKKEILDWMIRNEIDEVDTVGTVVAEYYDDKEQVTSVVDKDGDFKEISRKE